MEEFLKNSRIYLFIIILALFGFIGYFGSSYVEEKNLQIKELKEVIIVKEKKLKLVEARNITLNTKLIKLNNKFKSQEKDKEIIEIKNKDGSSKKITKIKSKNLSTNKSKIYLNKEKKEKYASMYTEDKKDSEVIKESKDIKESSKKEKTSGLVYILWIGGAVALCVATGVCVF
jgi:hypothetical protein